MTSLPPRSEFQPIITEITESLVGIVCGQSKGAYLPAWTPDLWRYAQVVASIQGIAPLLYFVEAGALGPIEWGDFLVEQYRLNTLRNQRILDLLDGVLARAKAHGAQVMPLKGVALAKPLYGDIGLRPMSDIDLFACPQHLASAQAAIEEAGFILADRSDRHISYVYPPNKVVSWIGEHPDNPIKLELHPRVGNRLGQEYYDITTAIADHGDTDRGSYAQGNYPSSAAMMFHLLHHAAAHMTVCGFRFIGLYDIHLLTQRFNERDWGKLRDFLDSCDCMWWAYGPLSLLQRYFPRDVPEWLMNASRAAAPEWLRRAFAKWTITQVSLCNLNSRYILQRLTWVQTKRSLLAYSASYLLDKISDLADEFANRLSSNSPVENDPWGLNLVGPGPRKSYLRRMFDVVTPNAYRWVAVERFASEVGAEGNSEDKTLTL